MAALFLLTLLAFAPSAGQGADGLAELRSRDARAAFTSESAARARAALEGGLVDPEARALAVLALGGGRAPADLGRIASALADGKPPERRAAVYALGEFGAVGLPALERALAGDVSGLEDALCLALVLAAERGAAGAAERLAALAVGDGALAACARTARDGQADAPRAKYLELRWRAARTYGLVDGQRGQRALAAELFADDEFLDRVVLRAAEVLPAPQLKAHLGEILLAGERPGALRVAALQMTAELAAAFRSGAWKPSVATWEALLAEIDAQRAERGARELVEMAMKDAPELEARAGALLLRAGGKLIWPWIAEHIEQGSPRDRAALVEACGERGAKEWTLELTALLERRPDLGLLGEGVVAATRLGHPPARLALEAVLTGPASSERDQVVAALARVLHDRDLWPHAEALLEREDLAPDQRLALEAGLALGGARIDRAHLRAGLATASGAVRLACVRALAAEGAEQADVDALGALFPVEGDFDLDVELAVALLRYRHPAITGLVRAALWNGAWNRSVLAGGLLFRVGGLRILVDEIASAPRTAREQDLRRVGFAIGEWGGLGAVEELARTRAESDPVLQGALLGALATRATESNQRATVVRPPRAEGPAKEKGAGPRKKRRKSAQE